MSFIADVWYTNSSTFLQYENHCVWLADNICPFGFLARRKRSKKTKGCITESERTFPNKQELALLLRLAGLIEVGELGLLEACDLFVRACLFVELEGVVSICEVLLCLIFHPVVGRNPVKKFGAVARVFGAGGLISLKSFVVPHFLLPSCSTIP